MFDSEILEGLSERVLADLGGRFGAARFGKGELIYSPFDRADAMYVVQSGRVRLYRSAHDGRQLTLAMLKPCLSRGICTVLYDSHRDSV